VVYAAVCGGGNSPEEIYSCLYCDLQLAISLLHTVFVDIASLVIAAYNEASEEKNSGVIVRFFSIGR
jgi:hypothetical protein